MSQQSSRLPVQGTSIPPPSKPDPVITSYQQNKRNSSISSDTQITKRQDEQNKPTEIIKSQRLQDISKESENRVLLSKAPSGKQIERPLMLPKRESNEQSAGTGSSRLTNKKTRTTALKPRVTTPTSSPRKGGREEGWKEVGRRSLVPYKWSHVQLYMYKCP